MAGQVRLDGQLVHKASEKADPNAQIEIASLPRYVSRGGEKLAAALSAFEVEPINWVCADVGASTGGFTDCLLQAGASKVYAIDVGKGQLHYRLRRDDRVIVLEETNVRHLNQLPERVDLVTIDVSFISLAYVLPVIRRWLKPDGVVIALIKPQFEAGKGQVGKGGVVRDPQVHAAVVKGAFEAAETSGLFASVLIQSPLKGPKGNLEFLVYLSQRRSSADWHVMISSVVGHSAS